MTGADLRMRASAKACERGVALRVVGQDPLDTHAMTGEERRRVEQEAGARGAALVVEWRHVGDPVMSSIATCR